MKSLVLIVSIVLMAIVISFATLSAQTECSALAEQAVRVVQTTCTGVGGNEACYGYASVEAEFDPASEPPPFDESGHVASISDIRHLQTLPFAPDLNEWGIALMQVQPNLPDALPGQFITFLLFGAVELDRSADSSEQPMSAFRLQTGVQGVRCQNASTDGLLIRTPHGAGRVAFTINGVHVSVGSTILFEAGVGAEMKVSVLEGMIDVSSGGAMQTVVSGWSVVVPMNDAMQPAGVPGVPTPFNADDYLLPLALLDTADTPSQTAITIPGRDTHQITLGGHSADTQQGSAPPASQENVSAPPDSGSSAPPPAVAPPPPPPAPPPPPPPPPGGDDDDDDGGDDDDD
jgi:hypothetical protein